MVNKTETNTELIVVEQLPVIKDSLLAVKTSIETRVSEALSLVCTEDTYKKIKEVRSALNKEYAELEKRRKEVKAAILRPYEDFEGVYKECAGDLYTRADRELGEKIREVENWLKEQKAADLLQYFNEYREANGISEDFVQLADAGIKVGLSDSKVSLHKQAAAFIDRISNDLRVINTQESRDELLAEYSGKFDLSAAILTVENRHKAIEAERKRREEMEAARAAQEAAAAKVAEAVKETQEVTAPVKAPEPVEAEKATTEAVLKTTFTVYGTLTQLKALKQFLTEGGYKYE